MGGPTMLAEWLSEGPKLASTRGEGLLPDPAQTHVAWMRHSPLSPTFSLVVGVCWVSPPTPFPRKAMSPVLHCVLSSQPGTKPDLKTWLNE